LLNQYVDQNGIAENGMLIATVLLFSNPERPLCLKKPTGSEAKPKNALITACRKHQIA